MDTIILKLTCKCNVTRIATKDCEEGGGDSRCGVIKTYSVQQSRRRGPGKADTARWEDRWPRQQVVLGVRCTRPSEPPPEPYFIQTS